jgi:hypothetical protein
VNYLENSNRHDFVICDDATGVMLDVSQRTPAVETLRIVHEVYDIIRTIKRPAVETFEVHCALRGLCQHLGWAPGDIAVVEHYAAATQAIVGGPTTG